MVVLRWLAVVKNAKIIQHNTIHIFAHCGYSMSIAWCCQWCFYNFTAYYCYTTLITSTQKWIMTSLINSFRLVLSNLMFGIKQETIWAQMVNTFYKFSYLHISDCKLNKLYERVCIASCVSLILNRHGTDPLQSHIVTRPLMNTILCFCSWLWVKTLVNEVDIGLLHKTMY